VWALICVGLVCAVAGSAALFWRLGKNRTDPGGRTGAREPRAAASTNLANSAPATVSPEDIAIETLCRELYYRCQEKDFVAMHRLIATPCKAAVTPAELDRSYTSGGVSYRFVAMESIVHLDGPSGRLARARFRRAVQDNGGEREDAAELKCVKEPDGWKVFRDAEWAEKIIADYRRTGFSEDVRRNIQRFCSSNPFDHWPANETNALDKIYQSVHPGANEVFPWQLSFSVTTNRAEDTLLMLGFTIRNDSARAWNQAGLTLQLKREGKVARETVQLLSRVEAGTEVSREVEFPLSEPLQAVTRYELDAFYTLAGGERSYLATGVPVEFKAHQLIDLVKCEVLWTSIDRSKGPRGEELLAADRKSVV
jgi:hypothetical protein